MTTVAGSGVLATNEIRIDGRDKVSGRMGYTADIHRPRELWAAFAISPFASAKILRIDTAAARAVDGVRVVLTGDDVAPVRMGRNLQDWPVLARGVVRFAGEHVAAVAAETPEAAQEAALLIEVTYEEQPAVLSPEEALAPGAPVLHPDRQSYFYNSYSDGDHPRLAHPNVQGENRLRKGAADLEPLFAAAHRVFEQTFTTPRLHAGHIEPRACEVWLDPSSGSGQAGTVHIVTCNKGPFALRQQMAQALGIPPERIVIHPSAIGGDFGGKGVTVDEYACYFLAKATGRPVRYAERYAESLRTGAGRHPARITLRTALDEHGNFIAHRSTIVFDGGAYAAGKPLPHLLPGWNGYFFVPYQTPNAHADISAVYTNTTPAGHVRAPVSIQLFFAWEQHVQLMAEALGVDPIAFRRQNTGRGDDTLPCGHNVWQWNGEAVLDALRREVDLERPLLPGHGRGVAFACSHTGGSHTTAAIALGADGAVTIETAVPDQGVGMHTAMQRIAADVLGIAPDRITISRVSTDAGLPNQGVGAAFGIHVNGRVAEAAARQLREAVAARTGTRWDDGSFVDAAGRRFSLAELAPRVCASGPLQLRASYEKLAGSTLPSDFVFIALYIEVELDRETGAYRIVDAVQIVDVGTIINPVAHQGQLDGGFVYGLGSAATEELIVDDAGAVTNISLGEYKLPTIADIPPLRTVLVQSLGKDGPFGAKAAGEVANVAVPAALANAVADAAGVRLFHFPITAERVYDALHGEAVRGVPHRG